jgi:glycosyltransferase involved in cell wall biosynthesis
LLELDDAMLANMEISLVGDRGSWGDMTPLLRRLRHIRYLGNVLAHQKPDLYRPFDALLVPSTYEPGPLSACEALACGRPVIASKAVGEIVGPCVWWEFEPLDVEDLRRALKAVDFALRMTPDKVLAAARAGANRSAIRWVEAGELVARLQRVSLMPATYA